MSNCNVGIILLQERSTGRGLQVIIVSFMVKVQPLEKITYLPTVVGQLGSEKEVLSWVESTSRLKSGFIWHASKLPECRIGLMPHYVM